MKVGQQCNSKLQEGENMKNWHMVYGSCLACNYAVILSMTANKAACDAHTLFFSLNLFINKK